MNQGSIADPSQTIKTHLREKTPAEKLAEHDAAATASNERTGADSRPAEITEAEKEEAKPTTVATIIGAALAAAIDWQSKGVDLRTVETPEFLDQVATAAKTDPTLVVSGKEIDEESLPLVKSLREKIADQLTEINRLSATPASQTEAKKEQEPKPEEEASGEKNVEPSGSKPKTLPPSGPAAKKTPRKTPKKKAANSEA